MRPCSLGDCAAGAATRERYYLLALSRLSVAIAAMVVVLVVVVTVPAGSKPSQYRVCVTHDSLEPESRPPMVVRAKPTVWLVAPVQQREKGSGWSMFVSRARQ